MRLLTALFLALAMTGSASAMSTAQKHHLKAQYYKANGVVHFIGNHARTTQYSPDRRTKERWTRALHYWVRVRESSWSQLHPDPLPPHYAAWMCIHSHEGSWTDSGDPFWGGLQFGPAEWSRFGGMYAPTADKATPIQQMWAAERYYALSGFSPWPNTARMCGLI